VKSNTTKLERQRPCICGKIRGELEHHEARETAALYLRGYIRGEREHHIARETAALYLRENKG
jgi:hypothetical protein